MKRISIILFLNFLVLFSSSFISGASNDFLLCIDSDGGINYEISGNVSIPGKNAIDYCNGNYLTEYLCGDLNTTIVGHYLFCGNENVCIKGGCINKEFFAYLNPPLVTATQSGIVIIGDVVQWTVNVTNLSGYAYKGEITFSQHDCGVDGISVTGNPSSTFNCMYTKAGVKNVKVKVSNGFKDKTINLYFTVQTDKAMCNDSDGGEEFYFSGYINYTTDGNKFGIYKDVCSLGNVSNFLREYSCGINSSGGVEVLTEYKCPNGCFNGACVNPLETTQKCGEFGYNTQSGNINYCDYNRISYDLSVCSNVTYTCSDSDGGEDYYTLGQISSGSSSNQGPSCNGGGGGGGGGSITKDSCTGNTLIESFCNVNGTVGRTEYKCPTDCSYGACVKVGEVICKDSCLLDNKCYPFGYRKINDYCSDSGAFVSQLKAGVKCDNHFECGSNVCLSNECVSQNLIERILNWFRRLFGIR